MAGGTFTAQNKIRPGAYINFKTNKKPIPKIGTRGVVTMPVPLTWGDTKKLIEITAKDFEKNGQGLFAKTGLSATGEESMVLRLALQNADKVLVYRDNEPENGYFDEEQDFGFAEYEDENIIIRAKYPGSLGNTISVNFYKDDETGTVKIYTSSDSKESYSPEAYILEDYGEGHVKPMDNAFVTFELKDKEIKVIGLLGDYELEGGEDGVVSNECSRYFRMLENYKWNVMFFNRPYTYDNKALEYIAQQRDNGNKVQMVRVGMIYGDGDSLETNTNYEGVIATCQGVITKDKTIISASIFGAYFAGMTAGADINQSNTYHIIPDAIDIIGASEFSSQQIQTHEEIEKALKYGWMVLSRRQDGAIVVEKDINSLHNFEDEFDFLPLENGYGKDYSFTKNRVIRTLDEIHNSTRLLFEKSYIGKVDNTEEGRNIFKADLINYLKLLQSMNCIQNFDAGADIEILAGNEIDELVVNLSIQPVDSMEKLYMTVTVG